MTLCEQLLYFWRVSCLSLLLRFFKTRQNFLLYSAGVPKLLSLWPKLGYWRNGYPWLRTRPGSDSVMNNSPDLYDPPKNPRTLISFSTLRSQHQPDSVDHPKPVKPNWGWSPLWPRGPSLSLLTIPWTRGGWEGNLASFPPVLFSHCVSFPWGIRYCSAVCRWQGQQIHTVRNNSWIQKKSRDYVPVSHIICVLENNDYYLYIIY